MIHVWRSFLGALAIVTISGCAVGTATQDEIGADEDHDSTSAPGSSSPDDLPHVSSVEARAGLIPVPSHAEPARVNSGETKGPYPEPWSSKPD